MKISPLWKKTQTEMVWAHNKINRTCKDDPTGPCTRRQKERQTEKEMGRQHNGMDRFKVGWIPSKGLKQSRMETSGCPIILGAPTVNKTKGSVKWSEVVVGRDLIFQPVLTSLPYTQTCTHNSDTIITLQNIIIDSTTYSPPKLFLKKGLGESEQVAMRYALSVTGALS